MLKELGVKKSDHTSLPCHQRHFGGGLLVSRASYKKEVSCLLVNAHHLGLPLAIAQILVSNVDDQRMKRLFIQACPYTIWSIFL